MPDDHLLSVTAARTSALQNADVVFLMGARFNWIFHPRFRGAGLGHRPRYAKDMEVQLDIAPGEIGHSKATEAALVGPRVGPFTRPRTGFDKAIVGQLTAALAGRQ
jgi:2-hydroxyacyl-CoA lyase 1